MQKKIRIKDEKLIARVREQWCSITACIYPSDACHIKSRGSGGDDVEWNLIPLCRYHHIEQHKRGWLNFSLSFPEIIVELAQRGWAINLETGKLRHFPEIVQGKAEQVKDEFNLFMQNKL